MINSGQPDPARPPDAVSASWWHRLIEPIVLFPAATLLMLALIWAATFNLINIERIAADRAIAARTVELADTYEAQVVRALRDIDKALTLLSYQLESGAPRPVLEALLARGLMLPPFLFDVGITDAEGHVVAGTRPTVENMASFDFFARTRDSDTMIVSLPQPDYQAEGWRLYFSQGLRSDSGDFIGAAVISVHSGYFVSDYDHDALGRNGVIGLVGTDGVFRVRRTGDQISAGDRTRYATLVEYSDASSEAARIEVNDWDDVARYTVARKLFEFPLVLVVGLSEAEQLAAADQLARTYTLRAAIASALLLGVSFMLGRLSWRLNRERARVLKERVEHAHRVEYLAFHDNLTGLPNRAFFSRLLIQGVQQARRYERQLALLFLDLDGFKLINDTLGHDAGDELLREIGRRLNDSVRESDTVARLGGDEFVVLLPELISTHPVTVVANKILAAIGQPFTLHGQEYRVTVSIGITVYPSDGLDEQALMKNADIAMYHAKMQGKNNFQFYSEQLNASTLQRLALESSLRDALNRDEFRLFYQARRKLSTSQITGMEALLRWEHPEFGLIMPLQFISLAEETGLILPIGRWVLRTACRQNLAWQQQGRPPLVMSVKLSPRQFVDPGLFADVEHALRETGMDPWLLELEITETTLMRDIDQTLDILNKLKKIGVRVAVDGFGSAYSSISSLEQFSFDTIKIRGAFMRDLACHPQGDSLTRAVIAVGRSMSPTIVAEGVETADQVDFLRAHACDELQGFYINSPMPAEDFSRLIRESP